MAKPQYNYRHSQDRKRALHAMQDGELCHLCQRPMYHSGDDRHLHYDHDPNNPREYRGLTHARCNTIDGARRGGQATTAKRRGHPGPEINGGYRASRNW